MVTAPDPTIDRHPPRAEVLGRLRRAAAGPHADVWRRFETVRRSERWLVQGEKSVSVLTNLVELSVLADPSDYRRLDELVRRLGHEQVATIQNRIDDLLRLGPDLPLLTLAITRLTRHRRMERSLAESGVSSEQAAEVAGRCYTHVFWMLIMDPESGDLPLHVATPQDLASMIEHGNARQWRAATAPLARNPWGPEGQRLMSLATEAHLPLLEHGLVECQRVYRLRQEERERFVVAREIRRMVAVSGLSQREFASYVGTSPSRLSTYVNGKVTPSATMLIRIKGAARMLSERGASIV